jgi:hypothetical protein
MDLVLHGTKSFLPMMYSQTCILSIMLAMSTVILSSPTKYYPIRYFNEASSSNFALRDPYHLILTSWHDAVSRRGIKVSRCLRNPRPPHPGEEITAASLSCLDEGSQSPLQQRMRPSLKSKAHGFLKYLGQSFEDRANQSINSETRRPRGSVAKQSLEDSARQSIASEARRPRGFVASQSLEDRARQSIASEARQPRRPAASQSREHRARQPYEPRAHQPSKSSQSLEDRARQSIESETRRLGSTAATSPVPEIESYPEQEVAFPGQEITPEIEPAADMESTQGRRRRHKSKESYYPVLPPIREQRVREQNSQVDNTDSPYRIDDHLRYYWG